MNPFYDLALALHNRNWQRLAAAMFAIAARVEPARARIHANHANCLSLLGRHDEALALAARAVSVDPVDWYTTDRQLYVLERAGEIDALAETFASGARAPDADRYVQFVMVAAALHREERERGVLAWGLDWVEAEPDNVYAWKSLALAYALKKWLADAKHAIDRAVELAPDDEDARSRQRIIDNGFGIVREQIEQAMAEPPACADDWVTIARMHEWIGEYEAAERAFSRALELEPDDEGAVLHLGAMVTHRTAAEFRLAV